MGTVKNIAERLKQRKFKVFFDPDEKEASWSQFMDKSMNEADFRLCILTKRYVDLTKPDIKNRLTGVRREGMQSV